MGKRLRWILTGGLALMVLGGVAWYLASPLFIDRRVDEDLPFDLPDEQEMEAMPEVEREALATEVMGTAVAMPEKSVEDPMPAGGEPIELRQGGFVGADDFHQASGLARIFELPDGARLLRFEDFMVTNGPDLHVLLATGASPTGQEDLGRTADLGSLKGNIGGQNYEIPPALDLEDYQSVVIYCVPFHVVVATADLGK